MNNLYPIFLKLENFNVLVVGGGYVGLEKITSLLTNSPQTKIKMVATFFRENTVAYARQFPQVQLIEKAFEEKDLEGQQFVIGATDQTEINAEIKRLAAEKNILCNVADTPHLCDFYLSSIVRKGDLKIAISTNGKSPTIAKRLKENLNQMLPNDLHDILQNMYSIREKLKGDFNYKLKELNRITKELIIDN
ncbi:MAG: bifunctional precorrin-2 dehydrogenase/sirohydrochlorin ferrochelatase [Bacteroidota bacterium]